MLLGMLWHRLWVLILARAGPRLAGVGALARLSLPAVCALVGAIFLLLLQSVTPVLSHLVDNENDNTNDHSQDTNGTESDKKPLFNVLSLAILFIAIC